METKSWYKSKTLWVNILALFAGVILNSTGFEIKPEEQVGVLAVVNLVLRAITKTGLSA